MMSWMMSGGGGRFGGGLSAFRLTVVTAKQQHNAVVLKTRRNFWISFPYLPLYTLLSNRETPFLFHFRLSDKSLRKYMKGLEISTCTLRLLAAQVRMEAGSTLCPRNEAPYFHRFSQRSFAHLSRGAPKPLQPLPSAFLRRDPGFRRRWID